MDELKNCSNTSVSLEIQFELPYDSPQPPNSPNAYSKRQSKISEDITSISLKKSITMNEELKQELTDIKRTITVMLKNVWSVADLSLVLDVSESRVRHMAAESVIPCYKQNGSLFFKRSEIENWQLQNRRAAQYEIEKQAATKLALRRIK